MHPTALLTPLIALYIPALAIPGQNFLAVTQASLEQSRRHGIVTALGVSSGSTLQAIVAALGVGFLMSHAEPIQRAVALLGGSYLLYMARAIWLQPRVPLEGAAAQPRQARSMLASYRQGLFTNLTNPKALVFFSTIFAGLLGTQASPSNRMLAVACIGVLSTSWYCGVAMAFTRPTVRGAYGRLRPTLSRLTALILGGFGLRLIWSAAAGR